MRKRENLVRAGLLLLVLGVIATLVVLDRSRGNDRPEAEPVPSRDPDRHEFAPLPTDEAGQAREARQPEADVIPTPPPGIEAIACQKLQTSVDIRVLDFNTHRSYGGIGTLAAEIAAVDPDIVLLQEIDQNKGSTGNIDQAAYFGRGPRDGPRVRAQRGLGRRRLRGRDPVAASRSSTRSTTSLPNGPGGEQRGLLGVGVEIGGQEVRIYNTHLQNKLARAARVPGPLRRRHPGQRREPGDPRR